MRKWTGFKSLLFVIVLVPGMLLFGVITGTGHAQGVVEQMLTPFDGLSALSSDGSGIVTNPAALTVTKNYGARVETVRPLAESQPDGMAYVYKEPDRGLGAGQLAYVTVKDGADSVDRFVYGGSKPAGATSSVGFGVTHTRRGGSVADEEFSTWGLDLGFHGQLFDRIRVGVVVRNAFLLGDDQAMDEMPPSAAAGVALDLGPVTLAGDFLMQGREAPFAQGYAYGLEARLGRVLLRIGERNFPDLASRYAYYGLGYGFDMGRFDVTVGERSDGQLLLLGVSLYF